MQTHCSKKNSQWWSSFNPRGNNWKVRKSPGTGWPYRISIDISLMCIPHIILSPDELIMLKTVIIWNTLIIKMTCILIIVTYECNLNIHMIHYSAKTAISWRVVEKIFLYFCTVKAFWIHFTEICTMGKFGKIIYD